MDAKGARLPDNSRRGSGRVVEFLPGVPRSEVNDARWQLTERIAGSETFRKAQRLREFLLYVVQRTLREPSSSIHEQEIGQEVFGRPPGYDTSQDSLVRVQASKLRRRLEQYFFAEGIKEPTVLSLPPGSYTPIFHDRLPAAPPPSKAWNRWYWILTGSLFVATVLLAALSLSLLGEVRESREAVHPSGYGPLVERFWRQMLAGGNPPLIVHSDANMTILQDLLGRRLTLNQYRDWRGLESATAPPDPSHPSRRTANWALSHFFVPFSEVKALNRIERVSRSAGFQPQVRFARVITSDDLSDRSVVLFGNSRVNPWVGAFGDSRGFRFGYEHHDGRGKAYVEVLSPRAGEESRYNVQWQRSSYCAVAFLPNQDGTGSALILEGADTSATGAGAALLTQESWMRQLWDRLSPASVEFPHFEVLLETEVLDRQAQRFRIVAHRIYTE